MVPTYLFDGREAGHHDRVRRGGRPGRRTATADGAYFVVLLDDFFALIFDVFFDVFTTVA
jgi:hypothetical protein